MRAAVVGSTFRAWLWSLEEGGEESRGEAEREREKERAAKTVGLPRRLDDTVVIMMILRLVVIRNTSLS